MIVYEINTAVWLRELQCGLADVPAAEWNALAALPADMVWLMGVWERSPAGLAIAESNPGLDAGFRAAVPDLRPDDVIGSPYCVRNYVVDERFGGRDGLAKARAELAARGIGLILDYVPNHVAPDHPWLASKPDCFIHGSAEDLARDPISYLSVDGEIVARGRDPYFPAWPDVIQLNAFSPTLRDAVAEMLIDVGSQCDGLRCDMAMLMTSEVFARTWHVEAPAEEFWPQLIARVKSEHPELLFIAEAYWDMEYALQQQGFDFCYDKRLYDRLAHESAESVRGHLSGDASYQDKLLRFIENHDEPRAADVFGVEKERAAAVVMSTVRGACLVHAGQLDAFRTHIPVFLNRGPAETPDPALRAFYQRLLPAVAELSGDWRLCDTSGWPDNDTHRNLVAWVWDSHLIVVNLSDAPAEAVVHHGWQGRHQLTDRLNDAQYDREGPELYVDLGPWGCHVLAR